jgi:hypothetical protein
VRHEEQGSGLASGEPEPPAPTCRQRELRSGTRTAADNGGSDWFTTNQGDVQVSADGTHGMLTATVQEQLAAVSGVSGSITIMGNSDNSVATKDCVVRPG